MLGLKAGFAAQHRNFKQLRMENIKWIYAATIFVSGIIFSTCGSAPDHPTKPNIVLLYTDDQGYGDVSALNPEAKFRTPNIDRIAREGVIFSDGHSSDGVCTPSRYSLLTGRYSWRTSLKKGVLRADGPCLIEPGRMTIASLLSESGYHTAMIGKWHLQMEFVGERGKDRDWSAPFLGGPLEHGFAYFFGIPASMNYGILTYLENREVLDPPVLWTRKKTVGYARSFRDAVRPHDYRMTPPYEDMPGTDDGWIEVAPSFNDELVLENFTAKAVEYLNQVAGEAKAGRPFFLYLPLTSPHLPHCTHPDFRGRSNCGNYGDFMEETDYRVGQLLEALDVLGLATNTLVIFSSDNGPETNYRYHREIYRHHSSLGFRGGKRDIYEGGHRVPFLMRWPGVIQAGSRVSQPVCQTDLLATVAEIVGEDLPDNAGEDSFSLLAAMKEAAPGNFSRGPVVHHSASGHFAIREGKWKLNLLRGSGGSLPPRLLQPRIGEPPFELYNLEVDPGENNNLYFERPDKVDDLKQKMTEIIERGRSTPGSPQAYIREGWEQLTWMEH